MELDDLKNTWNSSNINTEQYCTSEIIDQMTQKKFKSKIKKITYPEIMGSAVCLATVVYIGINFYKLDTAFLQGTGVLSMAILVTLSILSSLSLRQLNAGDLNRPYTEALKQFATRKLKFYKLQKINIALSYLLLVTVVILLAKFFTGNDITRSKYFWTFSFCIGYIFLLFFSKFVTRFYKNTLSKTEALLQEL